MPVEVLKKKKEPRMIKPTEDRARYSVCIPNGLNIIRYVRRPITIAVKMFITVVGWLVVFI